MTRKGQLVAESYRSGEYIPNTEISRREARPTDT